MIIFDWGESEYQKIDNCWFREVSFKGWERILFLLVKITIFFYFSPLQISILSKTAALRSKRVQTKA
jgi:hypothetical protein